MNTTTTESPFIESFNANAEEFYSQLYTSVPIGFALLFIYCIVRKLCINTFELKRNEYLLLPNDANNGDQNRRKSMAYPEISSTGYFQWIYDVWNLDSNTIYSIAGFDAVVFLLFLRCCVCICFGCMPYAFFVLLPIYATSPNVNDSMDWLDILSLNAIPSQSNRLYATLIGAYVFSFIALYYLSTTYLKIAYLTDQYLVDSKPLKDIDHLSWFNYNDDDDAKDNSVMNIAHLSHVAINDVLDFDEEKEQKIVAVPAVDRYTVMMRNVPTHLRDEQRLTQFMQQLFGGHNILKVVIVNDVTQLIEIEKKIQYHQHKLKWMAKTYDFKMKDVYNERTAPEIYGKKHCRGLCGDNIDLVTYHKVNREDLVAQFNAIQRTKELEVTSTAFVIFNSLAAASSFISSPKALQIINAEISKAPRADHIYWQNLYKSSRAKSITTDICVVLSMSMMLLFWSIPVIGIQTLANIEVIFSAFGGDVHDHFSSSTIHWLQGTLTVLVLDIWLSFVPMITDLFSKAEKASDRAQNELSVMKKYYVCLVFMVLLVTVISSAVLSGANDYEDYAKNIANNLGNLADLLANGLSNMAIYFLLYILLNTFVWIPLELFRPSYHIGARLNLFEPNRFLYSVWCPKILLIFTIVLTYSVMNPVMLIFGAMYFLFLHIVCAYNLCMNWTQFFVIGPRQWILIFDLIRYSFVISIVTLYGLILLKQHYICSVLLIVLLIFIWITTAKIKNKFDTIFKAASLISAHKKDAQIKQQNVAQLGLSDKEVDQLYLPSVLCAKYSQNSAYYQLP